MYEDKVDAIVESTRERKLTVKDLKVESYQGTANPK